jgi:hypothetical protein
VGASVERIRFAPLSPDYFFFLTPRYRSGFGFALFPKSRNLDLTTKNMGSSFALMSFNQKK